MGPTEPARHLDPAPAPSLQPGDWTVSAVVAAAAVLVYLNSLGNGFALDDVVIVADNVRLHGLSRAWELLLLPYWPGPDALDRGLYRPFTSLAFAVQWVWGDGSPLPFHLVNVALHGGIAAVLYRLLRSFVGWRGALAGALVFAVHPVHVEAVANVVGQAELWSALLVLTAAVVHLGDAEDGPTLRRSLAVAGLYAGAMLFKEHAVVLPALLVALDLAAGRLRSPERRRAWLVNGMLLAGVSAQYLTLRWIVLDGSLSGRAAMDLPFLLDPGTRVLTALSVWPQYLRLLAFPLDLSAAYDPVTLIPRPTIDGVVAFGALILGVGLVASLFRRSWPGWGLGFAWFFLTILPVSNLLMPVGTLLGERTLYLPSVAVALWVGFGVRALSRLESRSLRSAATVGTVVIVAAFATRTLTRNPVWRDNGSLFGVTLRDHPENFRAHWFHALRTAAAGDTASSVEAWRQARSIYGSNSTFLTQYAAFQRARGRTVQAGSLVDSALALRPTSPEALLLRGLLDADLGDPASAGRRIEELEALGYRGMAAQLADSLGARPR